MPIKWRGVNLIELMVTLVIICIVASFAIPTYTQHRQHALRVAAEVELMKLAAALERYYVTNNSYQGATLNLLHLSAIVANGHYRLTLAALENNFYAVTVIPITADEKCGELTVNSRGEKISRGTAKTADCW